MVVRRSLNVSSLSCQELRLSLIQRRFLRAALLPMVIACSNVREGQQPNPAIPMDFSPAPSGRKFNSFLANSLLRFWERLCGVLQRPGRVRLRLDVIELGLCALGVRALAIAIRHGHVSAPVGKHELVRIRLLRLLENARRRADRAAHKELASHVYSGYRQRWRKFSRWLRYYALTCRCGKPLVPGSNRRRYRWTIDMATKVAQRELKSRDIPVPEPDELRRLVRKVIRSIRRYRVVLSIRDLLTRPAGASYLAYVVEHASDSERKGAC